MKQLKPPFVFCLALLLFMCQSCYTYHVQPTNVVPASQPVTDTYWTFLWGAINCKKEKLSPDCHNRGLASAEIKSPIPYTLLSVITLGIVKPVKVTWTCYQCVIVQ